MNQQTTTARFFAAFGAAALTAVLFSTQLGLADRYTAQADALWAQQTTHKALAQAATAGRAAGGRVGG